jgi:hypothetical protein
MMITPSAPLVDQTAPARLREFSIPRTGKRGVPQQFPRHLFDMLNSETKLLEDDASHPNIIAWTESGQGFRIVDATEFAVTILPAWFRTKKFSSFQRNLNLVRFAC